MYSKEKTVICDYLAEFNCINSIDKRNGVVKLIIYGKPKTVPHSEKEYHTSYYSTTPFIFSKNVEKEVLVGYTLGVGEVVSASVTVICSERWKDDMESKTICEVVIANDFTFKLKEFCNPFHVALQNSFSLITFLPNHPIHKRFHKIQNPF